MSEESLFTAALEQPAADRERFLQEACGSDAALVERLRVLLAAHDKSAGILDAASEPAGSPEEAVVPVPTEERVGTLLAGRYKLLEQIGEGGMGTVWVAEQTQPVRRKVALKLIKTGMDSKTVLSRFEAERQALALMDHPNIAKVLDGGTTESGRPFFVMEYVKGVPITKYCDDSRLSIAERLALFVPVCQAVQHAHQKGIIHRDLKPSNILVCLYDGRPVPKVIDFGLAKAMHQPLTEHTLHTAHGLIIGTPLYMSPEQAELNNLDVDTRTDIYALGVILYELLTGTTPLEKKRFKEAAWQEMLRLIKEEEPPKPSVRLSGSGSLPSVAAQRKLEPAKLARLVRGELDWIVMKALDKDRSRRFETANGFAEDIQRYLTDEPVLAGPPTASYRLRKFVRRHRTGLLVTVGGIAAMVAVLTAVAGSIGWVIGERAAREAEITRRVRDLITLARGLAADNHPAEARQRLNVAIGLIAKDRENLPGLAAELDALVANLDRLRRFLDFIEQAHNAETTTFGYSPQRGRFLVKALACYEIPEREDWLTLLEQGVLAKQQLRQIRRTLYEELLWLANHAFSWWYDPRSPHQRPGVVELDPEAAAELVRLQSESAARSALAYLRSAEKADPPTHWFYRLRAQCHKTLGQEEEARKDQELAKSTPPTMVIDYFFEGLDAFRNSEVSAAAEACEAGLRLDPTHFWSLLLLGNCLMEQGQREPERVELAVSTFTGCIMKRPENARAYFDRGLANKMLGRSEKATKDFAKAKELNPNFGFTFIEQGGAYQDLRQWDKAISEYSKAVEFTSSKFGLLQRARVFINQGQWDRAIADYSEALEQGQSPHPLIVIYSRRGQWDKAVAVCSKFIKQYPNIRMAWEMRGELHGKMGQWEMALKDHAQAVKLEEDRRSKSKRASAWNNRGLAYLKLGKQDKALADFSKAIELDKEIGLIWSSQGYYGSHNLGLFEKARAELTKAIDSRPDNAQYPNALAWLLVAHADPKAHDPRRAVELAKRALKLQPKNGNYWNTLGAAHYRAGDWQAALEALDKSIEVTTWHDSDAYRWFFLAMAHWQLEHRDEARKAYDRAVNWMKELPNNPELNWPPGKGPGTDELRRFRAEAANLLGIKE
jgi:serine/threonine protein kinase/tetratricopeptide (TPR) repeat protein